MKKVFLFLTVLTILITGCTGKGEKTSSGNIDTGDQRLLVYTSVYPVYDFTKKIGGDQVEVIQIMPAGIEPHHFELSAKMLADLTKAKLLIYNGAGMEPWIAKIQEALAGSQVTMVDTSSQVNLISFADGEAHEEGKPEQEDEEEHEVDPHIWLSPANAKIQGQAILAALSETDPANAAYYQANYAKFSQQLEELDQEFAAALSKSIKKEIVVAHDALGYLAREYGLVQIPIRGLTAEAEPSPTKLKEIIELSRNYNIGYIFFESMVDTKVSEVIAAEIGAKTLEINPLDNLTEKQLADGEEYFSIMRKNLANLTKALVE